MHLAMTVRPYVMLNYCSVNGKCIYTDTGTITEFPCDVTDFHCHVVQNSH